MAEADKFKSHPTGLDTPIDDMYAITVGADFERGSSRALWAAEAVTVTLRMKSGRTVADVALQPGPNPIRAIQVVSRSASVTIHACY